MKFDKRRYFGIKYKALKELEWVPNEPGIYLWTRIENNITYWYVGQAKCLRNRISDYYTLLRGGTYAKSHFQKSLLAHKDWKVEVLEVCKVEELDKKEQDWIQIYLGKPYHQARNSTLGGQNGTKALGERSKYAPKKHRNEFREVLFKELTNTIPHLKITQNNTFMKFEVKKNKNGSNNKLSEKALEKLKNFLSLS